MRLKTVEQARAQKPRIVILALAGGLLAFGSGGCATAYMRSEGVQSALRGQTAADAAIAACEALGSAADDHAYYQGYLRIVVSPEPDRVDFTNVSDAEMTDQLQTRIAAYRRFQEACRLFKQLCEKENTQGAEQTYAALAETLKGLLNDSASASETRKAASELPADLAAALQRRRIARAQTVFLGVADRLAALWEKERPQWDDYLDAVYRRDYATGLLSLRLDTFDAKELAKQVNEPYGMAVKAGLFKLNKYQEALQKAAKLRAKLDTASDAFQRLADPHTQSEAEKEVTHE